MERYYRCARRHSASWHGQSWLHVRVTMAQLQQLSPRPHGQIALRECTPLLSSSTLSVNVCGSVPRGESMLLGETDSQTGVPCPIGSFGNSDPSRTVFAPAGSTSHANHRRIHRSACMSGFLCHVGLCQDCIHCNLVQGYFDGMSRTFLSDASSSLFCHRRTSCFEHHMCFALLLLSHTLYRAYRPLRACCH